jgi:two-component system, OmpR family, response regulator ChvI
MRGSVGLGVESLSAHGPLQFVGNTDAIRVVLVEEAEGYREALERKLSDYGFSVQSFADGASFLKAWDAALDVDVVLLDWALPNMSGIELLAQMHQRGVNLPVMFMTGSDATTLALDRGAINFVDKVRDVGIAVRRLQRIVRPAQPAPKPAADRQLVCGKIVIKASISRVYWDGNDVGLTLGEFNIVYLLASNAGRCLTYRAIYDRLHYEGFIAGDGQHGYRANVRSAIKRIRNKFRQCDSDFAEIENYTGLGYCWRRV